MGARTKRSIISALEHEGWEVHEGTEPGTIDLEAKKGAQVWLICVASVLDGENLNEAWPNGRRVGHLVATAKERGGTPVVALSTGNGISFRLATDRTELWG